MAQRRRTQPHLILLAITPLFLCACGGDHQAQPHSAAVASGLPDVAPAVDHPALRHRILLDFEGEAEDVTTDAIIENIVATLPVQAAGSRE